MMSLSSFRKRKLLSINHSEPHGKRVKSDTIVKSIGMAYDSPADFYDDTKEKIATEDAALFAAAKARGESSNIFRGEFISSIGHTVPPSESLRKTVVENGGTWVPNYHDKRVKKLLAHHMPAKRLAELPKRVIILKPEWVQECVQHNRVLPSATAKWQIPRAIALSAAWISSCNWCFWITASTPSSCRRVRINGLEIMVSTQKVAAMRKLEVSSDRDLLAYCIERNLLN